MKQAEFKNRFIDRMGHLVGQYEIYFEFAATAAYDMYKEDPDDLTPEEHADDEVDNWQR